MQVERKQPLNIESRDHIVSSATSSQKYPFNNTGSSSILVLFMQGCPEEDQAAFYWLQERANYVVPKVHLQTSRSMFDGAAGKSFHSTFSLPSLIFPLVSC
jgi:hypothetical protein